MDFDFAKFDAAFQEAAGAHHQEMAVAGLVAANSSISLDSVCVWWPRIKTFINTAIGFAAWIPGMNKVVPFVKAFVTAVDTAFMPTFCPAAASDKPAVHKNFNN